MITCNFGNQCTSNKVLLLLLITAIFSQCSAVTAAAKGTTEHVYGLKKLDFKTQGAMKFIILRSLVAPEQSDGTTTRAFVL